MTEQPTAEQRIADSMKRRAEYLAALYRIADEGGGTFAEDYPEQPEQLTDEDARERVLELGLGASIQHVLRIDLSTGGPADYLTAHVAREQYGWEVQSVRYHFADWFDHAEQNVPEDSPLWRYVEEVADGMAGVDDTGGWAR